MNEPNPNQLEQRIRQVLDTKAGQLDAETLSRLGQARQYALDQARHASRKGERTHIYWGTAVATAGLLFALGLTVWLKGGGIPESPTPEELEMLADTEELMLYKDLDFYLWLQQRGESHLFEPSSGHSKL